MLIVGCGDLGGRLAARAQAHGEPVQCLVRSPARAAALSAAGHDAYSLDLDGDGLALPEAWNPRRIYYLAPPPREGRDDPRVGRLLAALPAGRSRRIVYISTTGVYGDCHGEWVDETRPVHPQADRARRRLAAEERLRAWRTRGGGELVVLRVAGIYGPGKLPLERLARREPMVAASEAPWTNRIHVDDLVAVCEAAMATGRDGEVYNVSDGHPGNMRDYFDRVADLCDLPRAPLVRLAEAEGRLSVGLMSYLAESRRLDNAKMLDELGVRLRYPDLERGLAACHTKRP